MLQIDISKIRTTIRAMLENAENYNLADAPCYMSASEAQAFLAGCVKTLQTLDDFVGNTDVLWC